MGVLLFAGLCHSSIRECDTLPLSLLYTLDRILYFSELTGVLEPPEPHAEHTIECRESLIASGQVKGHLTLDSSRSQKVSDKAKSMAKECDPFSP